MWERLKRLFRSIFGGMIDAAEDPELILQQIIRDMRDQVPKLNENVAQVMSNEKLLEREVATLEREITELDSKIKAAIKMGRDDLATTYIASMQEKQNSLARAKEQLVVAKKASQQAIRFRDDYLLKMKRKQDEATQLISESKRARMQEQLAATMASFQVGDTAGSFDEMREKINRRAAAAEAKMELSTSGVDSQMAQLEREVYNVQAQDALIAYKRQMGLIPDEPTALSESVGTERTLGPAQKKALE
ncbi:PspA/IM30 family protein [Chloracidobacterium sp. MS 40/45]|jgi:phage shock protein A|uniref:PspA/IM30 family protein n=1 Tax=Chloracidobacterium aggregatum TaxID=2851959 RepID=UPI001B8C7C75|nr:PspA/IM30 family protein [Chloracidobacterium aggregatum]QUW00524.1 PspA/IM30 family protein [Chloracidobacterium sp. MS 40/45]